MLCTQCVLCGKGRYGSPKQLFTRLWTLRLISLERRLQLHCHTGALHRRVQLQHKLACRNLWLLRLLLCRQQDAVVIKHLKEFKEMQSPVHGCLALQNAQQ